MTEAEFLTMSGRSFPQKTGRSGNFDFARRCLVNCKILHVRLWRSLGPGGVLLRRRLSRPTIVARFMFRTSVGPS